MVSPARRCRCLRSNDSLTPLTGPGQPVQMPQMSDMRVLWVTAGPGSGPFASFGGVADDFADCRFEGWHRPLPTPRPTKGCPPYFEEGWTPHSRGGVGVPSVGLASFHAKKAGAAMYEDEDDDRFEAALRLAEDDPARGAAALRSIVADDAFDADTRSEAAARLAEVGG